MRHPHRHLLAALLLLWALPAPAWPKDHSHDLERAIYAAEHGEPARAKAILKQVLRKDPQDAAAKQALEDLIHPPKLTATPTPQPTPKPTRTPAKAPKAPPAAKPAAQPAPKPKATSVPTPQPKAKPAAKKTSAAEAAAAAAPLKPSLYQRFKAKLKGWLPSWAGQAPPAAGAPAPKEAVLPCKRVTFVYFGKTRSGALLKVLPLTSELVVSYNKGKVKISRDQVIKTEDCG